MCTLETNLKLCLDQFLLFSDRLIDLRNMFCSSIITRPIPNSTADKTKKKKVSDNIIMLSYKKPRDRAKIYNVIHKISAVRSRCRAFETLFDILLNIRKNNRKKRLRSPRYINYRGFSFLWIPEWHRPVITEIRVRMLHRETSGRHNQRYYVMMLMHLFYGVAHV